MAQTQKRMHLTNNGLRECRAATPEACRAKYQGRGAEHFVGEEVIAAGEEKWRKEMEAKHDHVTLHKNGIYKARKQNKEHWEKLRQQNAEVAEKRAKLTEQRKEEAAERAKSDSKTAPDRYFSGLGGVEGSRVRFPNPKDLDPEQYEIAKGIIKDSVDKLFEKNPYHSDVVIEEHRHHAFSVPTFQRDPDNGDYLVVEHRFHLPEVQKRSKNFDEVCDYAMKKYGYNDDEEVQADVEDYL